MGNHLFREFYFPGETKPAASDRKDTPAQVVPKPFWMMMCPFYAREWITTEVDTGGEVKNRAHFELDSVRFQA